MLTGIRYRAYPNTKQAETLSEWIGCAKLIWNAKCDEDRYLSTFAKKYLPVGTFPKPEQSYAQYKSDDTKFLRECPSQILRNSSVIWFNTYQKFLKGSCGKPRRKKYGRVCSIWLTKELFSLKKCGRTWELHIGTPTNDLGVIVLKWHRKPVSMPKSIWVRREYGQWFVSFCYEDGMPSENLCTHQEHLNWLSGCRPEELHKLITPIDRGIARPVQTDEDTYAPDKKVLARQRRRELRIKREQRHLARQKKHAKHSKRQAKTHKRISKKHQKTANVRKDFLHKTSRTVVNKAQVIVLEDLRLKNMTARPKAKKNPHTGRYEKNNAASKAGLNRALLGVGLGLFEVFVSYKAHRANKPVFKVNPINTSRECAPCGHIHPDNRVSQSIFRCQRCGHEDNADRNAAWVIRKRAISLILDSGTELAGKNGNILRLRTHANPRKTKTGKSGFAKGCASKKIAVKTA